MKRILAAVLAVTLTFGTTALPVSETSMGGLITAHAEDNTSEDEQFDALSDDDSEDIDDTDDYGSDDEDYDGDDGDDGDYGDWENESDFYTYNYDDDGIAISGYDGESTDVVIPSEIYEKK